MRRHSAWRLQFQIQNKNITIIYVNITTLKYMSGESWTLWHIKGRDIFICIFGVLLMG